MSTRTRLVLAAVLLAPPAARAATFDVNSPRDIVDANPGDRICSTGVMLPQATSLECSLRAAVQEANASAEADTIVVPAGTYRLEREGDPCEDDTGLPLALAAAEGDLDLAGPVTLTGAGADRTVIDASTLSGYGDRVLEIWPSDTVRVLNLTVRGGRRPDARSTPCFRASLGGGILVRNSIYVTLEGVTVEASRAEYGGGIWTDSLVDIVRCRIRDNHAAAGGGLYVFGGSQPSTREAAIVRESSITGNQAYAPPEGAPHGISGFGGGVAVLSHPARLASLHLERSTVSGNRSLNATGGGVYSAGRLRVTNSTISGNEGNMLGGGLHVDAWPTLPAPRLTVELSTIADNVARGIGGGLFIGGRFARGYLYPRTDIVNRFTGVIVARNRSGTEPRNCHANSAPVSSGGGNLEDRDDCGFRWSRDLVRRGALLGPLADNGGPTWTHALLVGSPAINRGPSTLSLITTDQRGVARPQGSRADVGAYEFDGPQIELPPGTSPLLPPPVGGGVVKKGILKRAAADAGGGAPPTGPAAGRVLR
jgi:CSLREA domain-containing protein